MPCGPQAADGGGGLALAGGSGQWQAVARFQVISWSGSAAAKGHRAPAEDASQVSGQCLQPLPRGRPETKALHFPHTESAMSGRHFAARLRIRMETGAGPRNVNAEVSSR